MKSLKFIVFFITVLLLTGCTEEAKQRAEYTAKVNEIKADPKNAEDNFITTTIESFRELKTDVESLKILIEDGINDTDNFTGVTPTMGIQIKNNDFTIQSDHLSDEQKLKYSKTIEFYSQGMDELHTIVSDYRDASETYDKRALGEIKARIDPAMELINKGIEQLEVERYQ